MRFLNSFTEQKREQKQKRAKTNKNVPSTFKRIITFNLSPQNAFIILGILVVQLQLGRGAFDPFFDLADMLGGWDIFRRSPSNALDGLPDLLADLLMRSNRLLLVIHPLTRQLIARLSHAELVGRQLGRIHTVHELFFLGDAFAFLDRLTAESAVEPLVTRVVKDSEHSILHPGFARRALSARYRFAGVGKAMVRFISRLFTGSDRSFDGILETPPLPVP